MEINTEINKVFGTEMAKVFAQTLSEDDIRIMAEKAYRDVCSKSYSQSISPLEQEVQNIILDRVKARIHQILDNEDGQYQINIQAHQILDSIREATAKKIIDGVSDKIAALYDVGHYGSLSNYIDECIHIAMAR